MIINELCGLEFDMERRNCYTLLRDFYAQNFGIELGDYACPTDWWEHGLDIYKDIAYQEGFRVVDEPPHMWRTGDVILMGINAYVGNHIAIVVPGGQILQHLRGERSRVTRYGGTFRNNTLAVYRHKDVSHHDQKQIVDLKDVLPSRLAKKLENYQPVQAPPSIPDQ